ncbi:hypothetical protein P7H16_18615 [Paenibacillus larvae]|uniref:hypothetical protein n=1 Tax=Paenibacillus larvae TaxID=1464 RepID=UPI00228051C4|nr:hypothetical protein [Paenibacillus larvae]MCY9508611.1 hypothetical protein [Paenibacillus larvae]MDT2237845.1 hypothetical protein [Paenibacillus larvae]MDT2242736.1 hypothetical protein [Paenibacillus larvae]MDT2248522.1 hypothetical protein [Paenibacillus larvae]MDT2260343.1 hypothetical protein [Paenibacillus larvae]
MKKFKKWLLSIAVVAAILGSGIALSTPQAYMDLVIKKISIPQKPASYRLKQPVIH